MDEPKQADLEDAGLDDPLRPPELPVKRRRSLYSQSSISDLDSEWDPNSIFTLQNETPTLLQDSSAPTDCQAAQCPIHHRHGRFLSEKSPPPLPKKRLIRTYSLPGGSLSPRCSYRLKGQNYDNPIYMIRPMKNLQIDTEPDDNLPAEGPAQLNLNTLDFNTPDNQLSNLFKNFKNQEEIFLHIQQCHLLFLKSVVQQLETLYLKGESNQGVESLQPGDFMLSGGHAPRSIGGTIFYPVVCPKLPARVFAAKVFKSSTETSRLSRPATLPPHVNIEKVFVYFEQCLTSAREQKLKCIRQEGQGNEQEDITTKGVRLSDEPSSVFLSESSTELDRNLPECPNGETRTVLSLLSEGCDIAVVKEVPWGTLEEFVQDGASLYRARPEAYERRLGLLLLQVTQGLQHLRSHSAMCTRLHPRSILLVWPEAEGGRMGDGGREEGRDLRESIEIAWGKWGAPRIVLADSRLLPEADDAQDPEELQLASLLKHCLPIPENPSAEDARGAPRETPGSPYTPGLLQLATSLQEGKLQISDAIGVLQVLLWGPRLLQQNPAEQLLIENWLSVKRSLLVLKLAERGVSVDQRTLQWEDYLCLQYHSLTSPDTILKSTEVLGHGSFAH
ncbi:inactive tyrosine-protein kinase PEAK1 [Brienomyrus brachyistius]|uniref:inactive tyrosine-protein kinase PEAK1 n=1 Tax=Brienomyrus brachyistius TaxID=42636 RepID=UPI0020B3FAF6|nr:inactive tyrosine-protein kinase PEAK1 [Brienomyrus brachyistius]